MGLFNLHFVALCGLLLITSTTAKLSPDSNGICYTYTIQGDDTCETIAAAHGMTVADIEKYNTNTFAWFGCKDRWYQGNFICLSSGKPPMPVALPQATCGPQVPGTARPSSWSELAGLNPCPSSECCTVWGACVTGPDCNVAELCIDNCEAGTSGTSSKTSSKTSTKTTATTLSTKTKQPATETVTHVKSTTKTKIVDKTTTVAPPTPTPTWSLTMYNDINCEGDYYVVEGTPSAGSGCISIQNGHLSTSSNDDLWCRYYTDGGFNSTSCDGGDVFKVQSYYLHGGTCLGYEHDCGDSTPGGESMSFMGSGSQCNVISPGAWGMAIDIRALRCTATS